MDLRGVFEEGQAYVALSRAGALAGLRVVGFEPSLGGLINLFRINN